MRVGSLLLGLLRRISPVLFEGLRAFGAACSATPARSAVSVRRSAASTLSAIGFSTSMCTPRSAHVIPTGACRALGVAMMTASECSRRSR